MAVLWCGGEDIDFPNGSTVVSTNGATFRSGFARCSVCGSGYAKSDPFTGTPATSGWLAWRMFVSDGGGNTANCIGIGRSSAGNAGIFLTIGGGNNDMSRASLNVFNGSGNTVLATTATGSVTHSNSGPPTRFDLQYVNYGVNGTLNLFVNGNLVLTYSGNISVPGITDGFDSVVLGPATLNANPLSSSEIIVADESTLGWQGLVTAAPNGNGTTQQWSNPAYTNINPISINDANSAYTDVVSQDEQVALLPEPAGNYAIKAVRVIARANGPAGAVPTGIELGFNNGTTVAVGSSHAITTQFEPYSDIFVTDPTTGQPWASMTGYQLNLRSA